MRLIETAKASTMLHLSNTTIITMGAFGSAVGHRVRERLAASPPIDISCFDLTALAFDLHPIVWASSCERTTTADTIDEIAHRLGRTWIPIVFEHPVIRVGPFVRPGCGACYRCFVRRRNQHSLLPEHSSALHALYDRGESLGPSGFLPHHVELAAAILVRQCDRLTNGRLETAEVVLADVISGRLSTTGVVPVHRCDRCGARHRGDDTWASFEQLFGSRSFGIYESDRGTA